VKTTKTDLLRLHVIIVCIVIQSLLTGIPTVYASQFGIDAAFLNNNSSITPNEVASNVFQLKNNTAKSVGFHLNYSTPAGWQILGDKEKIFEIAAGDSLFVPVRVIPDKEVKGGTSYIITVTVVSDKNVQFVAQNWYVTFPAKSNWTARIPFKHQFFTNNNDSSGFQVNFTNNGNSDEEIRLTLVPDRRIEILRQKDGGSSLLSFTFQLPAGSDTVIYFPVLRKPALRSTKGKDADMKLSPNKENFNVQVMATSVGNTGSWSGTTQFTKAGNIARSNEFAQASIPLTLEANVYDALSNSTTMSLDAYGNTNLPGNRLITYRFQTVFVNSYFNSNTLLGNNNYIGYFDEKKTIEIGEVNGWGRSMLTGRGVKGTYTYREHTIGAMYTRSPDFFNDFHNQGYGAYYNLHLRKINLTSNYSHNNNIVLSQQSNIYSMVASVRINPHHQLLAGGGYSTDQIFLQKVTGFGYDLNYAGSYKGVYFSAGNTYGSPEYVLARGVQMFTTRTSWASSQRNNFALSTQNFTQDPSYFVNGILVNGNKVHSDRYEFRWGINRPKYSLAVKPTYRWDENQTLRVAMRFVGLEYNPKNISGARFSAMGAFGYAKAVDYSTPDFFVSRINVYARWEKFYLSMRYSYGAYQLAEQARFVNDHITPQSVYVVGTYDYWLDNEKFLISTTSNFLYETYFQKFNFRLRPELFYYAKNGLRLSFYASFFSTSQGANPMVDESTTQRPFEKISDSEMSIGFGVRKQFGIPIPGKKFLTLHAVIFKDANGNHKQDQNEEGVENILVNIRASSMYNAPDDSVTLDRDNGEDFISNGKGEISYENIPAGVYKIKCTSLTPNGEWFDAGDQEFTLDSKKILYIPLTKGVKIKGSVLVERDKYSGDEQEIDLSRIRITALDSSGKSYSVLTNDKGGFVINLPTGQYILSVNDAVLGQNFTFIQNKINLDLSKNYENFSITFNAVEKKRKMEIKKFNNSAPDNKH
jgi:hypothetical protein